MKSFFLFAFILISALLGTACSGSTTQAPAESGEITSIITDDQAREMAENALQAYNNLDYAAYSRDWSDAMKAGISEGAFTTFAQDYQKSIGKFLSIESMEKKPGQNPGVVHFEFLTSFENDKAILMLAFMQDGDKIEGVTLNPAP